MNFEILIISNELETRNSISNILLSNNYNTKLTYDIDSVNRCLQEERRPSAIILDMCLRSNQLDGLSVLDIITTRYKDIPVIIVSAGNSINQDIKKIKLKAYDFIEKPFKEARLLHTLKRAIDEYILRKKNEELTNTQATQIIGTSSAFTSIITKANKVALTESRVLISGPIGSGKKIIAKLIHQKSNYSKGSFISFKTAHTKKENVEKELFGEDADIYNKNAHSSKIGALEKAHRGTIFFDEIADIPLDTQLKLLSFLAYKSFYRVGGHKKIVSNARIISSTRYNLKELIEKKLFNKDLFHRINVVPIKLLPLSNRKEDIEPLIRYFIKTSSELLGIKNIEISDSAIATMQLYSWPGNIRQLKNIIEQILIINYEKHNNLITVDDLPAEISLDKDTVSDFSDVNVLSLPIKEAREVFETKYLIAQLKRFEGNMSKTASFIKMDRTAFYRKLKTLNIDKQEAID